MWASYLEVPAVDTARLLRAVASVAELLDEVRSSIRSLPEPERAEYERLIDELAPGFDRILDLKAPFRQFQEIITLHVVTWVRILAARVSAPGDRILDADERSQIIADLTALATEVEDADDIEADVRQFLRDHIQDMLDALDLNRSSGVNPLRGSVHRLIGDSVLQQEVATRAGSDSRGKKLGTILGKVLLALSLGMEAYSLAQRVVPELPPIEAPASTVIQEHGKIVNEIGGASHTVAPAAEAADTGSP